MLPSGATATPQGTAKGVCLPVPVVLWIGAFQVCEASERLWMRLLSVSATQRVLPSGDTVIPVGWFRSPAGAVEPLPLLP